MRRASALSSALARSTRFWWQQQQQSSAGVYKALAVDTRGVAFAAFADEPSSPSASSSSRRSFDNGGAAPLASTTAVAAAVATATSSTTATVAPPSLFSSSRSAHTSATVSAAAAAASTSAAASSAAAASAASATASPRFFVTGARGQIGVELTRELAKAYGAASIVASDLPAAVAAGRAIPGGLVDGVQYISCDVTDKEYLFRAVAESGATHIVHLAAMLSAAGERNPAAALAVNAGGTSNVLSAAASQGAHNGTGVPAAVFSPSTIAVYGCPPAPRDNCGDDAPQRPTTMYGLTKSHQELLGEYYFRKAGVDYRSFRLPGVISADAPPGGGTTDYACAIFAAALTTKRYECYLGPDAELPFAHMEDVLSGFQRLLVAPGARLSRRTYSVSGFSATPAEWAAAVASRVPGFEISYKPDFRDGIARSWPASLDDGDARRDWGWAPRKGLEETAEAMLSRVDEVLRSSDAAAAAWGVPPPPLKKRSVFVSSSAAAVGEMSSSASLHTSLNAAP